MAKTESTAVNELISLVQNKQPQAEPASDLFSSPTPAPRSPGAVQPPRMTSRVPAMRGAGEVAPLPRGRAPQSTSSHQLPSAPPPVRMKTASPARGTTIPPLAGATTPPPVPTSSKARPSRPSRGSAPPIPTSSQPALPPSPLDALDSIEVEPAQSEREIDNALEAMWPEPRANSAPTLASPRITRPSLPPPKPSLPTVPAPRSTAPSIPPLRNTPRATLPPAFAPVAAPFDAKPATANAEDNPFAAKPMTAVADHPFAAMPSQYPVVRREPSVDLTADVVKAEGWFDVSSKVAKVDQTWVGSLIKKRKTTLELARMLVVPAIVAASVGVAIGVYITYRNPKQAPQTATPSAPAIKAPAPLPVAAPAPKPEREVTLPAMPESANAATASAGADQPQPPTKEESAATQKAAAAAAAANPDDPAAEPTLTHDAPAAAMVKTDDAVRQVQSPKAAIKLVDVRIDSSPSGATVTLVDNGKPSFLGTTPLATSLDPAHGYDVIFTLEGRPTQMAHLDPAKQPRLEVSLHHHHASSPVAAPVVDTPKIEAKAKPAKVETKPAKVETKPAKVEAKPAKAEKATKTDAKAAAKKLAEPSFDTADAKPAKAEKAKTKTETKPAKAALAEGQGTLMVSSKPPCDIYVDGKPTGLTTPQRSLPLAAGPHKITFVNATENIKKTVSVKITADQSTKLIQDLMAK